MIECSPLSAIGGWLMDLGLLISQLLSSTVDVTSVVSLDKKWLFLLELLVNSSTMKFCFNKFGKDTTAK